MVNFRVVSLGLALAAALGCAKVGELEKATYFGKYSGRLVTEWDGNGRTMVLQEPYSFTDWRGVVWDAPSGSRVDGASIPQVGWSVVGGPFEGKYRDASVIHDVACVRKTRPWDETHLVFYAGMRASGVSEARAKRMYAAVYHFGPDWALPGHPGRRRILEMDLQYLQTELQRPLSDAEEATVFDTMTLKDIDEFGKERFDHHLRTRELPDGPPVPTRKP